MDPDLRSILNDIGAEVARAEAKHAPMNSSHEGCAVILEEVDELWEEVRKQTASRSNDAMRKECVQIAAMAVWFIRDVCKERSDADLRRDEANMERARAALAATSGEEAA